MTIDRMHILFRQFAQQMGLQNVRGILPEQIDMLINASISDYVNQTVGSHLGLTSDKAIVDNAKVGQFNALKTLYKRYNILITEDFVSFIHKIVVPKEQDENYQDTDVKIPVWYFNSVSVVYDKGAEYKVRIVDEEKLSTTLHDALLKPTVLSPVGVWVNDELCIYFGDSPKTANNRLKDEEIKLERIVVSYIKSPKEVSISNHIDCDLPEYTHEDIVKHAVDLFKVSISGALYANQQQAGQNANRRKQQQENESE